jgi:hypothetical protein
MLYSHANLKAFLFHKASLSSSHFFFCAHFIITNVTAARLNGLPFSQLHWQPSSIPVPHGCLRVAILTLINHKTVNKLSPGMEYFASFLCDRMLFIDIIMLKPTTRHE